MEALQSRLVHDLYTLKGSTRVFVEYFELYNGNCYDLLNFRNQLKIQEDGHHNITIVGVKDCEAYTEKELFKILKIGNRQRKTYSTTANEQSSRSHAVFRITLET